MEAHIKKLTGDVVLLLSFSGFDFALLLLLLLLLSAAELRR